MRITGIHAENILSFQKFDMDGLDQPLTVLVGPNSAGKTNVFRLLKLMQDALSPDMADTDGANGWRARLQEYTHGHDAEPWIRVDLRLTSTEEKDLMWHYWVSSLMHDDDKAFLPDTPQHDERWDYFVEQLYHLGPRDAVVTPLLSGSLHLTYQRFLDRVVMYYEFSIGPQRVYWLLQPYYGLATEVPDPGLGSWTSPSLVRAWTASWSQEFEEHVRGYFAGMWGSMSTIEWDWDSLISWLRNQPRLTIVQVSANPASGNRVPRVLQTFWNRLGLRADRAAWSALDLWRRLFAVQVVASDNPRAIPRTTYTSGSWDPDNVGSEQLAAHLFGLKTGSLPQRERFQRVQAVVRQLSGGAEFDVVADVRLQCDKESSPQLNLEIRHKAPTDRYDYPLKSAGAGLSEIIYLSTVLCTPNANVVLLDEPGANLHTNALRRLQGFLEGQIQSEDGPQVFMVTHTPYLVPTDALQSLRRIYRGTSRTQVSGALEAPQDSRGNQLATKRRDFWSRSPNLASLLFFNAVLLVDGPTEVGALSHWYEQRHQESLEDRNVGIFSVDGKGSLEFYLREVLSLHVPWIALVDGDSLQSKAGSGTNIWWVLERIGVVTRDDAQYRQTRSFAEQKALLNENHVYVRGFTDTDTFETIPELHPFLSKVPPEHSGKVRKGYWLAKQIDCPSEFFPVFDALRAISQ